MKRLIVLAAALVLLLAACKECETSFSSFPVSESVTNESVESQYASTESQYVSEQKNNPDSFEVSFKNVEYLYVTTSMSSFEKRVYSDSEIIRLTEIINQLEFENEFEENPGEYTGMSHSVLYKYADGSEREFIVFGQFFKEVGSEHEWKKIGREQGSEITTLLENLSPVPDNLNVEELIRTARERLCAEELCTDYVLSHCIENVEYNAINGTTTVEFELCIHGYESDEEYRVTFSPEGEVVRTSEISGGLYSRYLFNLLSYEETKEAQKRLVERAVTTPNSRGSDTFLTVDGDGRLCLCIELIVNIAPQENSDGTVIEGCGFDHDHVFLYECISTVAFGN